jgi:hypothetical protein
MKKILSFITCLAVGASAYSLHFKKGWQLKGALEDINVSVFKNSNIKSVWTYDDNTGKWKAYIPNAPVNLSKFGIENLPKINKGEGFWVKSLANFSLNTTININETVNNETNNVSSKDEEALPVNFDNVKKVLKSMNNSYVTMQLNNNSSSSSYSYGGYITYKHCLLKIDTDNQIAISAKLYGCTEINDLAGDGNATVTTYDPDKYVTSVSFMFDGTQVVGPDSITPVTKVTPTIIEWSTEITGGTSGGFIEKEN